MNILNNKFSFAFLPTPVHRLNNLSDQFKDYNLYIKRDDQTGLASGGNKTRKLEYLVKDAVDKGYNAIFTAGAQQSNHCRQTAAACAIVGIECYLILRGYPPQEYQGNLLLSQLLGAKIHFTKTTNKVIDYDYFMSLVDDDKKPYLIPIGGSNITGSLGYFEAVKELKTQLEAQDLNIDYIVFASSSGGTQAGLMLGMQKYKLDCELIPIKIDKDTDYGEELAETVQKLCNEGVELLELAQNYTLEDIPLNRNYNQAEYGVLTEKEKMAIDALALSDAVLLDPVYTGRAFYGMLDLLQKRHFKKGSNILFWHTGGLPALFHYGYELIKNNSNG